MKSHASSLSLRISLAISFVALAAMPALVTDEIIVTSVTNGSVLRYDASGSFLGFLIPPADPLISPHGTTRGPDGNWYVTSFAGMNVRRYSADTGAFIDEFISPGAGGLGRATHSFFGPDGNFYVSAFSIPAVLRYDGLTGDFIDQWIAPGNGLEDAELGEFGPDGHYYIANGEANNVLRYHGETGAFIDEFVTVGSGDLDNCHALDFRPDGQLFVTSFDGGTVLEYDGETGAFVSTFVASISQPHGLEFRPDGLLYVTAFGSDNVLRYDAQTGAFVDEFITAGLGGLNGPNSIDFSDDDTLNLSFVGGAFRAYLAEPGERVQFFIDRGAPQAARPFAALPSPVASRCDLTLHLERPIPVATAIADSEGVAAVVWSVPPGLLGLTVRMQAFGYDSCRSSDVQLRTLN